MTVKELMEVLSKLNNESIVHIYNGSYDSIECVNEVEVNQDGEIVLY